MPAPTPDKNSDSLNIQLMSEKMVKMKVMMKSIQHTDRDFILLQCNTTGSNNVLNREPSSCM